MAKPRTPSQRKAYRDLRKRLAVYGEQLRDIFDGAVDDGVVIAAQASPRHTPGRPFRFADHPGAADAFSTVQTGLFNGITALVERTTGKEWSRSNSVQDRLASAVLGAYGSPEDAIARKAYYDHHMEAREAYMAKRRDGSHGWSRRVWNLKDQNREELEMALSAAFEDGVSAQRLATEVKKYLNEPNRLFRRVRDAFGNLHLSKNAAAYHPGVGVYRSSFRNALRLTQTETNMAYRRAENLRWQDFDFVVGFEIHLSGSHPAYDICDILQGKYPKEFDWMGWHPNCLCYKTAILKTEDEFWNDEEDAESVNTVKEMPAEFDGWMKDNDGRLRSAAKRGKEPWWVRDNAEIANASLKRSGNKPIKFGKKI